MQSMLIVGVLSQVVTYKVKKNSNPLAILKIGSIGKSMVSSSSFPTSLRRVFTIKELPASKAWNKNE